MREERTQWRDLDFSLRHRMYGFDCPAVDIDFLLVEYDSGLPKALVEYKRETAAPQVVKDNSSYNALRYLADHSGIPFFGVRYRIDFSAFRPAALNREAHKYLSGPEFYNRMWISERDYVRLLYRIRGRECPSHILQSLNG